MTCVTLVPIQAPLDGRGRLLTHFLFAHTLAAVLDILTLVVIGTSLRRSSVMAP